MNPYSQYHPQERKVAYFSMEIGLAPELPIYSGGLGILAGDTIKSFADLSVPAVGISLLYTKGYFGIGRPRATSRHCSQGRSYTNHFCG